MATHLDDKTKVPFVWVAVAIPFLVGGIFWLASVETKATEARAAAVDSQSKLVSLSERLVDIRERLIRIEDALNQK
jgi:hypothetical protein